MAEIDHRRNGELVRALFAILLRQSEGMQANAALSELATSIHMTPHEAGSYSNGARRFEKIVRFATINCVKAGWLVKVKGTWTITEEGDNALRAYQDPEVFYRQAVRLYNAWSANNREFSNAAIKGFERKEDKAEDSPTVTYEQADEQAWNEIERFIGTMNPYEFQDLVADLLKAMGYFITWISPPGKDGGVDIIAHIDPLGTRPPRVKVQVKRVQARVDKDGLSSFLALIGNDDAGLFVATAGFTKDAEEAARRQENRKITLIDLDKLVGLWIQFYSKLDDKARSRLPLTPIYFLTPLV